MTDRPTGAIYIYDRDGRYQRTFRPAAAIEGWQPLGLAFDAAGNLYVTDLGGPAARSSSSTRTGKRRPDVRRGRGPDLPERRRRRRRRPRLRHRQQQRPPARVRLPTARSSVEDRPRRRSRQPRPAPRARDRRPGRVFVVDSSGQGVLVYSRAAVRPASARVRRASSAATASPTASSRSRWASPSTTAAASTSPTRPTAGSRSGATETEAPAKEVADRKRRSAGRAGPAQSQQSTGRKEVRTVRRLALLDRCGATLAVPCRTSCPG